MSTRQQLLQTPMSWRAILTAILTPLAVMLLAWGATSYNKSKVSAERFVADSVFQSTAVERKLARDEYRQDQTILARDMGDMRSDIRVIRQAVCSQSPRACP